MHAVFVQLIGFAGLLCFMISFQVKNNRRLFLAQAGGSFVFLIQFILLHAYTGCLNLAIGLIRNLLLLRFNEWKWVRWKGLALIFIGAFGIVSAMTWHGWTSLLPFAAMAACTLSFWSNNARIIRITNLFISCPCWVAYDVIFGSIAGVLNESITMLSILISIWRYGWKSLGDPGSGFSD